MSNYPTQETAEHQLMADGFTRYQSCINGQTLFTRWGKFDPASGQTAAWQTVFVQRHDVEPRWGHPANFYTVEVLPE